MKTTGLNLFFRGVTLVSKFFLSVFIVKYLTLEELGVYGIFSVSIGLVIYILGLDFYTYSSRSILEVSYEKRGNMLFQQLLFYFFTYIIFLPLIGFIFFYKVIEMKYICFFYALTIVEHISVELYRLLVVFSKPVWANFNIFLRSGTWCALLLLFWFFGFENLVNIESVLIFWVGGGILSIIISLIVIFKEINEKMSFHLPLKIDWNWISKGVVVSLSFFIGTVSYKIIEFTDRYMIDYWMTKSDVGIYTFFSGISNLIEAFVQASVIMVFTPKLLESFNSDKDVFKEQYVRFKKNMVTHSILIAALCIIFCYPLIIYLNKIELVQNFNVFLPLALSKVVFNFSLIYHYYLYSVKKDKAIVYSTLAGAVTNIILNIIFIPTFGLLGAAWATLLSFMVVLLLKYNFYLKEKAI